MTTETSRGWQVQITVGEAEVIKMRQEINRLKAVAEARDIVIDNLNNELKRLYRKISHGCTDANCKECDR